MARGRRTSCSRACFGLHNHRLNIFAAVVSIAFGTRSFDGHGGRLTTVLGLLIYALAQVGGAIADLAWNSWHVYVVRTILRLPLLIAMTCLAAFHRARGRQRRRSSFAPPPPTTSTQPSARNVVAKDLSFS